MFSGEFNSYIRMCNKYKCNNKIAIGILLVFFACFAIFTFFTPEIGIFKDPTTNSYGTK